MVEKRRYEEIPRMSPADIEAAMDRNDPGELLYAVVSAALYSDDPEWAENVCVRLATHPHFNVRGNAVLGFGHLARIHGRLTHERVLPLIEAARFDAHEYVRSQADATIADVEHFLGWRTSRPNPIRDWYEGENPAGVVFGPNEPVRLTGGPDAGLIGSVVSLLGLEPEPHYIVELQDGTDTNAAQSWLAPP